MFCIAQFKLSSVGFDDIGVYTCSASYKGFTRYIYSFKLVVKRKSLFNDICHFHCVINFFQIDPLTTNEIVIKCNKVELEADIGENVEVECTVHYGRGNLEEIDYNVYLYKANTYSVFKIDLKYL